MRQQPVTIPAACAGRPVLRAELTAEFRVISGRQFDRTVGLWANNAVVSPPAQPVRARAT
jgi:hypothetical protein